MPPTILVALQAALVANCFLGALPAVLLGAVCFVRAMVVVVLLQGGRVIINCRGVPRDESMKPQVSVFSPASGQIQSRCCK